MSKFDPERSALLLMDFHTAVVEGYARDQDNLLLSVASALSAARAARMLIIFVVVGFRPGYPEVNSHNPVFSEIKRTGGIAPEMHPRLSPAPGEIIVTKHRISAFVGTDLKLILRSNNIDHLVMSGVATSGVVLSTLRQASDMDFRITLLTDCVSDRDEDLDRCLKDRIFSRHAELQTAKQFVDLATRAGGDGHSLREPIG